ncbi:MAG: hypothetical protein NT013_29760, partial [Planctomycetia bacterium]|nr:hypothetical protein [Planctomycetia bacterium]
MNRTDFQVLAKVRLNEAKTLLDQKQFDGAYYYHDRELILHKKRVCVITASPLTEGGAMPRKAVRIEATERQLEILR